MFLSRFALPALFLTLGLAGVAQAQTAAPADTARYYKHHLGLTASPVLDQFFTANRSLPVGLLYKRQTAPNKLWRFGLVVNQDYSRRDEDNPNPPTVSVKTNDEYVFNNSGASISLGREATRRFSARWTGTYGVDVGIGFSRFMHDFKYQRLGNTGSGTPPVEYEQVDRFRYFQAALTPFIGMRFTIVPQLYMSAESVVSLSYSREVIDSYSKSTDLSTGQIIGANDFTGRKVIDQSINLRYKFINQLTLHYMLGRQ